MLKRLREPSTWAGLAAAAAVLKPDLAPVVPVIGELAVQAAALVAAAAAVLTREKGHR